MKIVYTYRIGWSKYNKHYYGVRYANVYDPKLDLWRVYFTSSRHVKNFRKLHGEPDIVQVRKQFIVEDSNNYYKYKQVIKKARSWERNVLRRLNVKENTQWLNIMDSCKKPKKPPTQEQILRKEKKAEKQKKRLLARRKKEQQIDMISQKKKLKPASKKPIIYSRSTREDRKRMVKDLLD